MVASQKSPQITPAQIPGSPILSSPPRPSLYKKSNHLVLPRQSFPLLFSVLPSLNPAQLEREISPARHRASLPPCNFLVFFPAMSSAFHQGPNFLPPLHERFLPRPIRARCRLSSPPVPPASEFAPPYVNFGFSMFSLMPVCISLAGPFFRCFFRRTLSGIEPLTSRRLIRSSFFFLPQFFFPLYFRPAQEKPPFFPITLTDRKVRLICNHALRVKSRGDYIKFSCDSPFTDSSLRK